MFLSDDGKVGVGTDNPQDLFQVGNNEHKLVAGSAVGADLDYGTMYIGFNAARNGNTWSTNTDGANNGGAVIYSDINGGLCFVNVGSEASGTTDQAGISDLALKDKTSMYINKWGSVSIGTL